MYRYQICSYRNGTEMYEKYFYQETIHNISDTPLGYEGVVFLLVEHYQSYHSG